MLQKYRHKIRSLSLEKQILYIGIPLLVAVIGLVGMCVQGFIPVLFSNGEHPIDSYDIYTIRVLDNTTRSSIAAASVELELEGDKRQYLSDDSGLVNIRYRYSSRSSVSGKLVIDTLGYQPVIKNIRFPANLVDPDLILLIPTAHAIPSVQTTPISLEITQVTFAQGNNIISPCSPRIILVSFPDRHHAHHWIATVCANLSHRFTNPPTS